MKPCSYAIQDEGTIEVLKNRLRQEFASITETTDSGTLTVYDTFDWRLHKRGWQLLRQADRLTLVDAAADQPIDEIVHSAARPLHFPTDLAASALTDRLESVLEMRALLPVVETHKTDVEIAVRDEAEKTIVRLQMTAFDLEAIPDAARRCRIEPLKGYARAARAVRSILDEMGLSPTGASPLLDLMKLSGASPGEYSTKVDVSLDPAMPAAEAVQRIMQHLVNVMHQNLAGVREDIDTEFLHDLRVSVRRARSLLGQTKGVLDSRITATLQDQLKAIGTITGPVRDLDVYLLAQADYIAKVPDFLRPGVVQLFQTLSRKRRYAFQRMVKAMAGSVFEAAMADLDAFVAGDALAESDAAAKATPIGELARTVIYKRFRKVIKKGRRISAASADERLHELRIDCKKLRYLLEFFTSLFPEGEMKQLIKQLKQLQENLGAFNDLSVQQAFLIAYLDTIKPTAARALLLAAATGGLIARLHADQRRVRGEFFNVFDAFDAPDNRKRFKSLFA